MIYGRSPRFLYATPDLAAAIAEAIADGEAGSPRPKECSGSPRAGQRTRWMSPGRGGSTSTSLRCSHWPRGGGGGGGGGADGTAVPAGRRGQAAQGGGMSHRTAHPARLHRHGGRIRWSGRMATGIDRVCEAYGRISPRARRRWCNLRGRARVLTRSQSDNLFAMLCGPRSAFRRRFTGLAAMLGRSGTRAGGCGGRDLSETSRTPISISTVHLGWVRASRVRPVYLVHDLIPDRAFRISPPRTGAAPRGPGAPRAGKGKRDHRQFAHDTARALGRLLPSRNGLDAPPKKKKKKKKTFLECAAGHARRPLVL